MSKNEIFGSKRPKKRNYGSKSNYPTVTKGSKTYDERTDKGKYKRTTHNKLYTKSDPIVRSEEPSTIEEEHCRYEFLLSSLYSTESSPVLLHHSSLSKRNKRKGKHKWGNRFSKLASVPTQEFFLKYKRNGLSPRSKPKDFSTSIDDDDDDDVRITVGEEYSNTSYYLGPDGKPLHLSLKDLSYRGYEREPQRQHSPIEGNKSILIHSPRSFISNLLLQRKKKSSKGKENNQNDEEESWTCSTSTSWDLTCSTATSWDLTSSSSCLVCKQMSEENRQIQKREKYIRQMMETYCKQYPAVDPKDHSGQVYVGQCTSSKKHVNELEEEKTIDVFRKKQLGDDTPSSLSSSFLDVMASLDVDLDKLIDEFDETKKYMSSAVRTRHQVMSRSINTKDKGGKNGKDKKREETKRSNILTSRKISPDNLCSIPIVSDFLFEDGVCIIADDLDFCTEKKKEEGEEFDTQDKDSNISELSEHINGLSHNQQVEGISVEPGCIVTTNGIVIEGYPYKCIFTGNDITVWNPIECEIKGDRAILYKASSCNVYGKNCVVNGNGNVIYNNATVNGNNNLFKMSPRGFESEEEDRISRPIEAR